MASSSSPPRITLDSRVATSPSLNGKSYETFGSYQREDDERMFLTVGSVGTLCGDPSSSAHSPSMESSPSLLNAISETLGMKSTSSMAVQAWLIDNSFDENAVNNLREYSLADLLKLSKSDTKDLLGVKSGIRLYNRLKAAKNEVSLRHSHRKSSASGSSSSSPALAPSTSAANRSPTKTFNGPHCSVSSCHLEGEWECAGIFEDQSQCTRRLCVVHSNKSLITGHSYCADCYEKSLSFSQISHSFQQIQFDNCRTQ